MAEIVTGKCSDSGGKLTSNVGKFTFSFPGDWHGGAHYPPPAPCPQKWPQIGHIRCPLQPSSICSERTTIFVCFLSNDIKQPYCHMIGIWKSQRIRINGPGRGVTDLSHCRTLVGLGSPWSTSGSCQRDLPEQVLWARQRWSPEPGPFSCRPLPSKEASNPEGQQRISLMGASFTTCIQLPSSY